MYILGIDPGTRETAYAFIDRGDLRPIEFAKVSNELMVAILQQAVEDYPACDMDVAIENVGHYGTGMPAGKDVFDTCRWIGRYEQIISPRPYALLLRKTIVTNFCGKTTGKDANVSQALADRFAPGEPNKGKGTKNAPGWFYGFKDDIWSAYAVAVTYADQTPF